MRCSLGDASNANLNCSFDLILEGEEEMLLWDVEGKEGACAG